MSDYSMDISGNMGLSDYSNIFDYLNIIDKDDNFKYPAVVKNYGLLSMDMIFYFNNN